RRRDDHRAARRRDGRSDALVGRRRPPSRHHARRRPGDGPPDRTAPDALRAVRPRQQPERRRGAPRHQRDRPDRRRRGNGVRRRGPSHPGGGGGRDRRRTRVGAGVPPAAVGSLWFVEHLGPAIVAAGTGWAAAWWLVHWLGPPGEITAASLTPALVAAGSVAV